MPTGIPRILSCKGDHTHKCLKVLEKEELRQNTTRGENHCKIMKYRAGARKKAAQGRAGGRAKSLSISEGYFMKFHSRTIVCTIATCVPSCAHTEALLR